MESVAKFTSHENKVKKETSKLTYYVYIIVFLCSSLLVIGLTFVFSASYSLSLNRYGNPFYVFFKQILWVIVGFMAMFIFTKVDTSLYKKWIKLIVFVGIIIGLLPFVPGIGKSKGEAMRWINLGFFTISSSEILKLVLPLYISVVLSRKENKKNFVKVFLPIFIVTIFFFLLISLQLDLSSALLVLATGVIVMYVGGVPLFQIVITIVFSSFFILFWGEKYVYIQNRIFSFLDPWSDPFNRGYHYIYMLKSFENGILGLGLGNGIIKEKYLPEPHTDSIFAVVGEETGLIGTMLILISLVLIFFYSAKLAVNVNDSYKSPLIIGLSSTISLWGVVNVLVNLGLLPPTGTSLPLISYGGSNVITSLIALGIIYRVYKEEVSPNKSNLYPVQSKKLQVTLNLKKYN
ncbi:MAG: FtsW/RodA/SpoVE family cell cycle protein [Brevinematia bacterium]